MKTIVVEIQMPDDCDRHTICIDAFDDVADRQQSLNWKFLESHPETERDQLRQRVDFLEQALKTSLQQTKDAQDIASKIGARIAELEGILAHKEDRERCPFAVTKGYTTLCQPPKNQRELIARVTELEADARRYRWLKDNHLQLGPDCWIRTGDDLDEAIDAELPPA